MKKGKHKKSFWKDLCVETEDYLQYTMGKLQDLKRQNAMFNAYIDWKGCRKEFEYFEAHAHEEHDTEIPFSRLVL